METILYPIQQSMKTGVSRAHFYDWCKGKRRISLQIASKIVDYTGGNISFKDMVKFEKSFDKSPP